MNKEIKKIVVAATLIAHVRGFSYPFAKKAFFSSTPISEIVKIKTGLSFLKPTRLFSFVADGSDYKSSDSDYENEEENDSLDIDAGYRPDADAPVVEAKPVPNSKNSGSRFVAFIWDSKLDKEGRDHMELHEDREILTEDHVLYCRKANLYNETFNFDSMVDVVWSYPLLSSDLGHMVGQAICLDSNSVDDAKMFLSKEPVVKSLTGGDISSIPFYRWRHIKDHTLRQDKGRFGTPTMIINLDRADDAVKDLRASLNASHIEYLIRSERVIQTGPLHVCTKDKNDPDSVAIGSIVIMNAESRNHAIDFAENDPCALAGVYETIRVHGFCDLDISGKFVLEDRYSDDRDEMREAMEIWGYPVGDEQTPWING